MRQNWPCSKSGSGLYNVAISSDWSTWMAGGKKITFTSLHVRNIENSKWAREPSPLLACFSSTRGLSTNPLALHLHPAPNEKKALTYHGKKKKRWEEKKNSVHWLVQKQKRVMWDGEVSNALWAELNPLNTQKPKEVYPGFIWLSVCLSVCVSVRLFLRSRFPTFSFSL